MITMAIQVMMITIMIIAGDEHDDSAQLW